MTGRGIAVEVRDVVVTRGGRTILGGASFTARAGEVAGLVGPSGSGKSTIINVILGLMGDLDSGTVQVGPYRLPMDSRERRAMGEMVAWIPQSAVGALDPQMSVDQILLEGMKIHGRPVADKTVFFANLLGPLGLGPEILSRRPNELSGGQAQRVVIARALALDPALVIADEPTSALDPVIQAEVLHGLVSRARATGATVILVSHSMMVVRALCDTVTVIDAGRTVESGLVSDVLSAPTSPRTRELLACEPRI